MKTKTDYAAHIAGAILAALIGAGTVALAGGTLVDGRDDGPGFRDARARAAHAVPPTTRDAGATPAPARAIRITKTDAARPA